MQDELSPSEVASLLGTSTRSVQRWIAAGRLPARRLGGRWRVAIDALDAFWPEPDPPDGENLSPERRRSASREVRPIRRLFVANRGEVARRIRRTATHLGIEVIEPTLEGPGALDLLDARAVTLAAQEAGADALHPGFGFLAESAEFADLVELAGMAWVGPPPEAIVAMGDKAAARQLAAKLGVPVIPGYDGADQTDGALRAAAKRVGYPLLVKPSAGGGGKGMHVVPGEAQLAGALATARREAMASFGDGRLILERWVEGPRHVEVQVLFDAFGNGVHLGERDCSTQRRHQKVLEEAPSPAVRPPIRKKLTEYALELARAVGYRSAGTCEFLLTDLGEIFFLEMNTRLQVEHPVTEEILGGVDLVELQLRIAERRPLDLTQPMIEVLLRQRMCAVEVRLYAEDAEHDFLPATGRIERLTWPAEDLARVDSGVDEGSIVGARFDPMLAKIVARAGSRETALSMLAEALDRTTVLGLTTNLRFLRWLVRQPAVRRGQMRIDTLPRIWPPDDWATHARVPDAAWGAAARALAAGPVDGWRLNGPPLLRLATEDAERTVSVAAAGDGVDMVVDGHGVAHVDVGGLSVAFRIAPAPDVDRTARAAAAAHHGGGPVEIVAPMPGAILAVHVAVGEAVEPADTVVTLAAMKMEHAVPALIQGRVVELRAKPGDQVARGDVLAVVEP